jgi:exopolysaccharide biosynthesis polyprenyl glycosylphosphotransferase
VVVGNTKKINRVIRVFSPSNRYGELVGFVSTRKSTVLPDNVKYLGSLDNFSKVLEEVRPDEVILSDLEMPRKKIIRLILEAEKKMVSFKIVADLLDIMVRQFELENIDGLNLVKFKESPLNYAYNRALKRIVDLGGSLLGLILFSPLFLIIGICIKLDSKGRVFFSQERMSEDGRVFKIYKFRTMYEWSEKQSGPVFAEKDDKRCTRLGKLLRRYNLDELPQLFNVLKGEMSLVGPRPERPYFVNQFKEDVPRYMSRHHIKSGITGWAQVNGLRQGSSIEERIKYDLYYLENWSLWFDFKIMLMSIFATKNAY